MTEWIAHLRPVPPLGDVRPYAGSRPDSIRGAAEALAHFSSLEEKERSLITLESNVELTLTIVGNAPRQLFTVAGLLHYLRHQPEVLSGLRDDDIRALTALAEDLGA